MSSQVDHDVFNSQEGKRGELATMRHKKFIRELDFKMQQQKQVAEVLLPCKHPVVESACCLAHQFEAPNPIVLGPTGDQRSSFSCA